jgi:hypothetical protein
MVKSAGFSGVWWVDFDAGFFRRCGFRPLLRKRCPLRDGDFGRGRAPPEPRLTGISLDNSGTRGLFDGLSLCFVKIFTSLKTSGLRAKSRYRSYFWVTIL